MLDTSKWTELELDVLHELHLDPKNVRLEITDAEIEADIIEDLFVNEDALGLVEGICKVGYLTHETPVVVLRQERYIMVEGNRRLAALKAIQNPMLVPECQSKIATLVALLSDRSTLRKIRVMLAPDQAEADQLIAAIHTGNLRKPWSPARQAAFFQAQIDAGRNLKELLVRYPTVDVKKFVFRAHVVNLFKSISSDSTELMEFVSTKEWAKSLSTLARIYESREFTELTGLAINEEGRVTHALSDDTFRRVATLIVEQLRDGELNTRTLNSVRSARFVHLMKELRSLVPENPETAKGVDVGKARHAGPSSEVRGTETRRSDETTNDKSDSRKKVRESPPRQPQNNNSEKPPDDPARPVRSPKKKQKHLDLSQVRPPASFPQATALLLGELSALDIQQFPNTAYLALRASLEKAIKSYAEAKSIDIRDSKRSEKGHVQLNHALDWLLEHVKENGPTHLQQPIEKVRSGKLTYFVGTKDALNAINHNHHFMVEPDEVIAMWAAIDSIMRHVMKP